MPLLEVQRFTHVTANHCNRAISRRLRRQVCDLHSCDRRPGSEQALEYVFAKEKEFQKFLASDEAEILCQPRSVCESLGPQGKVSGPVNHLYP